MSTCGKSCGSGCCSDFSSKAPRKPSLLQIDVVEGIFEAAVRNMTMRRAQLDSGMMSPEEYSEAFEKLVEWIAATFQGGNAHYEADPEWHLSGGLTDLLREKLREPSAGDDEIHHRAARYFADDADGVSQALVEQGGLHTEAAERARRALASAWAQLYCGGPGIWEDETP